MSFLMNVIVLFVAIFTVWFYKYYKYKKYLFNVKGPRPLPILGNALEFISEDVSEVLFRLHQQYGSIFTLQIGFFPPMVSIIDNKFIEFIMRSTTTLNKSDDYKFLHPWLGNSLLTAAGAKWKKHRKLISPSFHFENWEHFIEIYKNCSDILVNQLSTQVGKPSVNIYKYINLCSLDIICEATMGASINAQGSSESDYVYSVKEMCRIIIDRSTSLFKSYDCLFYFSKDYYKQKKALQILHNYSNNVITLRKKAVCGDNAKAVVNSESPKKTFLDLLLKCAEGNCVSQEEIREEVDTFMFAGHDTISAAISFLLFCLARYQDIQDRVVEELNTVLGLNQNNSLTYANLQRLKYLEAVIKETLRLYPPVPIYCRRADEDIPYGNLIIPKDTSLVIYAYGIHRCPQTYPNPENFDPNRFLNENSTNQYAYSYIPFSAGPRNCIGQKFAMLEMKVVAYKILKQFRLLPTVPEHKLMLRAETVLKSKNGIRIQLEERR